MDTFEKRLSLDDIVNRFDISFLKELELSQREYETEKAKAVKQMQEQSANLNPQGSKVRTITNAGKVVNRNH